MSGRDHLLLAIDTAGAEAGLVLEGAGRTDVAWLASGPAGSARTEDLSAAAAGLLHSRGADVRDVALLGIVLGPGSWTGLRSGLAFLRGLAFVDATPAVGVGALELLAWRGAQDGERVAAAVEAGSGRLAMAVFRRSGEDVEELSAPRLIPAAECCEAAAEAGVAAIVVQDLARFATADRASPASSAGLPAFRAPQSPSLESLARLVRTRARAGRATNAAALVPLYVGEAHARPNRHRVAVPGAPE